MRSRTRRLAGGASAIVAVVAIVATVACEPTRPIEVGEPPIRHAACDVAAMPTYALVNGAWKRGDRFADRELYMEHGRLRERAPAHVDDTLDLRGLTLVREDDDIATFVGLRDANDERSVALRVSQGCVIW